MWKFLKNNKKSEIENIKINFKSSYFDIQKIIIIHNICHLLLENIQNIITEYSSISIKEKKNKKKVLKILHNELNDFVNNYNKIKQHLHIYEKNKLINDNSKFFNTLKEIFKENIKFHEFVNTLINDDDTKEEIKKQKLNDYDTNFNKILNITGPLVSKWISVEQNIIPKLNKINKSKNDIDSLFIEIDNIKKRINKQNDIQITFSYYYDTKNYKYIEENKKIKINKITKNEKFPNILILSDRENFYIISIYDIVKINSFKYPDTIYYEDKKNN